jgi:hypothetical protein
VAGIQTGYFFVDRVKNKKSRELHELVRALRGFYTP